MLEVISGHGVADVTCIQRTGRLKEQHVNFNTSDRTVFCPARYDHEFTLAELHALFRAGCILKFHTEATMQNQEQFILRLMMMPDKFALKLYQLDVLPVQFAHDFGRPMILKCGELLRYVDLVHASKVAQKLGTYRRQYPR
jgi:hypothetical protein